MPKHDGTQCPAQRTLELGDYCLVVLKCDMVAAHPAKHRSVETVDGVTVSYSWS